MGVPNVCAVTRASPVVYCDHCLIVIPKSRSLIFAGAAADRKWLMMAWLEALSDPRALRRCIRALVALSTLLAIWQDYDPQQMAAALVPMVGADLVSISLPDRYGRVPIEVFHAGDALSRQSLETIQAALRVEFSARTGWQQSNSVISLAKRRSRSLLTAFALMISAPVV